MEKFMNLIEQLAQAAMANCDDLYLKAADRIAELEAQVHQCPDCGDYCKECRCTEQQIAELEAEREGYLQTEAHLLQCIKDHKKRIAELETANDICIRKRGIQAKQLRELQARLDAVKSIVEQWWESSMSDDVAMVAIKAALEQEDG